MKAIEIPVRELHARTGHYVRKAARHQRVVITDRGVPVAEIVPLAPEEGEATRLRWEDRLREASRVALRDRVGMQADSSLWVAEDRGRG